MNKLAQNVIEQIELTTLNHPFKISKDGYSFELTANKWVLNKDVIIRFQSEILTLESETL